MSDLSINTGSTNNNIINPLVTPKLKFEGKFNYPVITLGSNNFDGGLYSLNGGRSWDAPDTLGYTPEYVFIGASGLGSYMNLSSNLNDVCIFSWVASGAGGSIKHLSHDGGRNWTSTYYGSTNYEYAHFNKDTNNIYLGGWSSGAKKSVDAGETLTTMILDNSRNPILFDSSDDENYVYASYTGNGLQRSTNQGTTWTEVVDGGPGSYRIVKCTADGQYVFGYYGNYSVAVTMSDDYGVTYSTLTNSTESRLDLRRDGSCFMYTAHTVSRIYFSIDQGSNWTFITSPWGSTKVQTRSDYTNGEIYLFTGSSNLIYRVNDDGNDIELVKTLDNTLLTFDASQYGRGFVYTSTANDIYFSRNSQTWELIREDDGTNVGRYLMIL